MLHGLSRRLVLFFSILALALAFAACSDDDDDGGGGGPGLPGGTEAGPGGGGGGGGGEIDMAQAMAYCSLQCDQANACDEFDSDAVDAICDPQHQQLCAEQVQNTPAAAFPQTRAILECIVAECENGLTTDEATDSCTQGMGGGE